jgi:hypothetical protein
LVSGNRWRNTSTVIPSPTAISICGSDRADSAGHQLMQTGTSAETWGGRIAQRRMSAM